MQRQRRERVDTAKTAQPRDRGPQSLVGGQPRETLIQRLLARDQPIDGGEQIDERQLGRRLLEALGAQPRPVALVPRRRARIDPAVREQQLGDR
jgi:hypothetical protein